MDHKKIKEIVLMLEAMLLVLKKVESLKMKKIAKQLENILIQLK